MQSASADVKLETHDAAEGAHARFFSSVVLPFGSTWPVAADLTDLGGLPENDGDTPVVQVLADPGLFVEDGFESSPEGPPYSGSAAPSVVTSVGTLPAIAGAKSLLIPPGGNVLLHLGRTTNIHTVHFTTQMLSKWAGFDSGPPPIEIATIGGTHRVAVPPLSAVEPIATDGAWPYASPKQQYDLALVDSGTEIAVRIAPKSCWNGLCGFSPQAMLSDDLWVE